MQDTPPSERQLTLAESVTKILASIGEDPDREGLKHTPLRVAHSLEFLTSGYAQDVDSVINGAVFSEDCDEMVLVKDVEVYSLCEHHMLPFFGRCHVAYLPAECIIGLSKIARVVDIFSHRLQVQERLTSQIAHALEEALQPKGVAVVMEARHLCMMMRGVQKQNSLATTSCMLGRFREDPKTRSEFLTLLGLHHS